MTPNVVTILVSALVLFAGLLVYAFAGSEKVQRLGFAAYVVGLFWLVGAFASHVVRF
ncbi:MAG TPA: hypothetical protein VGQ38_15430 [Gaiellaceae bacterium]|jgi:hypothetical protein|nr:hypothetical protein [Gaiellaceae bacterium]